MTDRYRAVELAKIPLKALIPVKISLARLGSQDHCRWVLRTRSGNGEAVRYYKIWNPTYVRRDNLPAAIASGFVDQVTVPALDGLIFHEGLCRGYVMNGCEAARGLLDDVYRQLIYRRTRLTRHFFVQLSQHHVMRFQGLPSLVDLESIYPVSALPELPALNSRFEDPDYARMVTELYRDTYPAEASITESLWQPSSAARRHRAARIARRIKRALRNQFPRTDLISAL